jgi:uncharacterized protein (DUF1684 family)
MRRIATSIAAAGLAALFSCDGSRVTMSSIPAPQSWEHELAARRRAKDVTFASDPDSPIPVAQRAAFRSLNYFPLDPAWRYAGSVERYATPERMTIVTTRGTPRPCERWGRVTFAREGRVHTLQIYRLLDLPDRPGGEGLFLPFKDRTTGNETYAAGRYVDLEGPDDGPFVLDFNNAYNPSCAYGEPERFQCPVTPAENALSIEVRAGERGPARSEHERLR